MIQINIFGEVVDSYTMTESVKDEITVRIVYEGRAAKVCLDNSKLTEIEAYYKECADSGSNELQIEDSKKATANMNSILGDPDRIRVLARTLSNIMTNALKRELQSQERLCLFVVRVILLINYIKS